MAIDNGSATAKQDGTAARIDRALDHRLRMGARDAAKDFEEIGSLAKEAQEKLGKLGEDASGYLEQGQEKVRQIRRTVEQFVREEPVKTVLIAAGVGLLFGRFWMRR